MATTTRKAPKQTTKPLTCGILWTILGASPDFTPSDLEANARNKQLWSANEKGFLMLTPAGEAALAAHKPTKATPAKSNGKAADGTPLARLIAAGFTKAEAAAILLG